MKTTPKGAVQACSADVYLPDMPGYIVEQWTGWAWVFPVWQAAGYPQLAGPFRSRKECNEAIDATNLIRRDKK